MKLRFSPQLPAGLALLIVSSHGPESQCLNSYLPNIISGEDRTFWPWLATMCPLLNLKSIIVSPLNLFFQKKIIQIQMGMKGRRIYVQIFFFNLHTVCRSILLHSRSNNTPFGYLCIFHEINSPILKSYIHPLCECLLAICFICICDECICDIKTLGYLGPHDCPFRYLSLYDQINAPPLSLNSRIHCDAWQTPYMYILMFMFITDAHVNLNTV